MATPYPTDAGLPIRPTSSSVLVTTKCPLPVTSFTFTITPRLMGTMPTPAVPPFLSSNSSPWNLNVSQAVAAAAGAPVASGYQPSAVRYCARVARTVWHRPIPTFPLLAGSECLASCLALTLTLFSSSYPVQERWGGYAAFTDKICGDEVQIFGDFYYDDVKQHDELAPIATGSFSHGRAAHPGHSAAQ